MTEAPSVFRSAVTGWRDAFAAVARMPITFGVAIAAIIALSGISIFLFPIPDKEFNIPGILLSTLVFMLVQAFLLTPVAIAVHRYVLLSEITPVYRLNPAETRFRRFYLFTLVIQAAYGVPF